MAIFGQLLRTARERSGKSLGMLARHLNVSVPYLSDVERDKRPPLVDPKIYQAAAFLGIAPSPLIAAAAERRGAIELDALHVSATQREVGYMLAAMWRGMSDEKVEKMRALLLQYLAEETGGSDEALTDDPCI